MLQAPALSQDALLARAGAYQVTDLRFAWAERRALGKAKEPADMKLKLRLPTASDARTIPVISDLVKELADKFARAAPNEALELETDDQRTSSFVDCLGCDLANASEMHRGMFQISDISAVLAGGDVVVSLHVQIVPDNDLQSQKDPMAVASDLAWQVHPGKLQIGANSSLLAKSGGDQQE